MRGDQQAEQRDGEQRAGHEHVRVRGGARDDQLRRRHRRRPRPTGVGDGVPSGIASSPGWRRQRVDAARVAAGAGAPPLPAPKSGSAPESGELDGGGGRRGRRRGRRRRPAPAWPSRSASASRRCCASSQLLLLLLALAGVVALDRRRQRVAEVGVLLLVGVLDRPPRPLERPQRVVAVVDPPVALEVAVDAAARSSPCGRARRASPAPAPPASGSAKGSAWPTASGSARRSASAADPGPWRGREGGEDRQRDGRRSPCQAGAHGHIRIEERAITDAP